MPKPRLLLLLVISVFLASIYNLSNSSPPVYTNEAAGIAEDRKEVKVILLGDIMLGRSVNTRSLDRNNPNYPFEKVADKLRSADIVFANLESPIVENCPKTEAGMIFCADPKMAEGLKFAGIDVLSLANNHILNYSNKGLEDTKRILEENEIEWVSAGKLKIFEKEEIKFGFLGFEFVDEGPSKTDLELIAKSSEEASVLIVATHWGWEYKGTANSNQRKWARMLVSAGADIVVGHHPHWIQDTEEILGKKVYYSLGNFVFDQMWSEKTREGLVVLLTFQNGEVVKEEKLPVYMENWAQPEWVHQQ